MKNLLLAVLMFMSFSVYSQSFDGVPISGDLYTVVAKYKAKGYIVSKYIEQGAIMKGKVAGAAIELFVFITPKSKKVCKVVAYLNEDDSWVSLKSDYNKYFDIFIDKYGLPDGKFNYFREPYYEGDGYELQAVGLDKVVYSAYWMKRNNLTVSVEISKFKQIKLAYENDQMMNIKDKEQSEIELNSF